MSDAGTLWREQPEEKLAVNLEQIVNRRTEQLYSSTRSEILTSVAAALVFVAVMVWRFAPIRDRLLEVGIAAVVAWVVATLYWFRRRIGRSDHPRPDALAASGLDYYRKELERRRDHLRNAWLWHGPLVLACGILVATVLGKYFPGAERLRSVVPLLALLVAWVGFGFWRRRRQAQDVQREIDDIGRI